MITSDEKLSNPNGICTEQYYLVLSSCSDFSLMFRGSRGKNQSTTVIMILRIDKTISIIHNLMIFKCIALSCQSDRIIA